jgi:GNAT superfamily N-acetyltransferase
LNAYRTITFAEAPTVREQLYELGGDAWPEFQFHDPIAEDHFGELYEAFPQHQIILMLEDEIVGFGNTISVTWDGTADDLPLDGWDGMFMRGINNRRSNIAPTTLMALQVVIAQQYQGKGASSVVLMAMRANARAHGLNALIAPVRPILKHRYPLTPMERYITWRQADGTLFDPWLRTHAKLGATIERVCPQSTTIEGTVEEWERWTEMRFPESGEYIVPGALVPVTIDCEANIGRYVEPNVWMKHGVE